MTDELLNTKPILPGYQIGQLIGEGVCGCVWAAEDPMGNAVAVRVLDERSVNLNLMREVGRRLDGVSSEGHGPLPIWMQALELTPPMEVTPLLADAVGDEMVPRNLQIRLADYLATSEAESVVKCLAKALAELHQSQVVHGNLKPGNVFVSEEGKVLVGDYGLGWMPGIEGLGFSDALLYMAPEQLQNPEGLLSEAGYRWDVFAFGVLAYRLLEGVFPRCHESFEGVAPVSGLSYKGGIEADSGGVAQLLLGEELRPWRGDHPQSLKWIVERCLSLDPRERFRDMVELCTVWEREMLSARHAAEMKVVGVKLRRGRRWKTGLSVSLAVSVALGLAGGISWLTLGGLLSSQIKQAGTEVESAEERERVAALAREQALEGREDLVAELASAVASIELLGASRQMLFEWALTEGADEVPLLIGREGRLALLDSQYEALIRVEGADSDKWKEQWETERALVALSRNELAEARDFVGQDVSRLGGLGLTRLLLKQSGSKSVSSEDLALARMLVKEKGGYRELWLQSALDLVEVRDLERAGEREQALGLLSEVGRRVDDLPALEPGVTSLWRSRLQRETAEVAEGAGRESLAFELRSEIVGALRNELGADGLTKQIREELSEQFVIAAEGLAELQYSMGMVQEALALAEEALALIPESADPRLRMALAVHEAVIAGCIRGREPEEARVRLDKGLVLLATPFKDERDERWRRYRMGMLQWQLSGVRGQAGEKDEEFAMGEEALKVMRALLEEGDVRPSPIQVHHVMGYLSGDLAQAYGAAGKKERHDELLDEAIESWIFLQNADPKESEYLAGLAWCEKLRSR